MSVINIYIAHHRESL